MTDPIPWYPRGALGVGVAAALLSVACTVDSPSPEPISEDSRALGSLALETGEPCGDGDRCIRFVVTCPEVTEPARGYLIVDDPTASARGTITSFSGGPGTFHFAREGGMRPEMRTEFDRLREEGFRIVQVVWEDGWTVAAPESDEGLGRLACRPATVTAWIDENLTETDEPLCVVGGSGGAAQVSYLLSHYGLEDRLDLVLPFTGYWMGRIDLGCLDDDPLNASMHYNERARAFIDRTMGYPPGEGPCSRRDPSARAVFESASISLGGTDYTHPNTLVYIVLGGGDDVGALVQGHTHYTRLLREDSPRVHLDILHGAPHGLGEQGPGVLGEILEAHCRVQEGGSQA